MALCSVSQGPCAASPSCREFRRVEPPTQAEVDQAIGSMIGGATQSGLSTSSTIAF
jgi:hypothetical protein